MKRSGRLRIARAVTAGIAACSFMIALSSGGASASSASGKTIEYIVTSTGIPYYNPVIKGFNLEAARLGLKTIVTGPSTATAAGQLPFIQQAIVKHVSGISLQTDDPYQALLPILAEARAAGIKVVDNAQVLPTSARVASITPMNYSLVPAQQLAQLGELMHYSGTFAILSASSTSVFQNVLIGAMLKLLKSDPKYAKMSMVKLVYGNDISATSAAQTDDLLTEFPKLTAIYSPTTVGIAAAAQAVDNAKLGGRIVVTGLGEPVEMRKFILNGTVTAYQLWDPEPLGIVSAYILYESILGRTFTPGKSFQVPGSGLGKIVVQQNYQIYASKLLLTLDKANVNQYSF
jgi:rhamnose transport system substrate-binding protein